MLAIEEDFALEAELISGPTGLIDDIGTPSKGELAEMALPDWLFMGSLSLMTIVVLLVINGIRVIYT